MNEKLEDLFDIQLAEEANAEFEKNPITYSLEEVMKEYGIE